ncbi:hypothetical protein [Vibrio paucivorans]
MIKAALIRDGAVINTAKFSAETDFPANWKACPEGVSKEWRYLNDEFLPPKDIQTEIALEEASWVKTELAVADIEINKHLDGCSSTTSTEANWRNYRNELRAYTTSNDNDITVARTERPQRPS